ncbi:cyclophilin-like fold protein [Kineococcus rubinsiae]|uniref:cyclophilin-like fold protein n=1 Tax=Kineococcus rubinsiae TaxID=2609562 RepID=UPI001AD92EFB|nr:cyclophilin-like fold protein [Kineococcus rubinsiae]
MREVAGNTDGEHGPPVRPPTGRRGPRRRLAATSPAAALVAVLAAGCGAASPASPAAAPGTTSAATTPGSATTPGPAASGVRSPDPGAEGDVRVRLTVGDEELGATLTPSAATRDLLAQLPVTVEMGEHGGVEKTGPLPSRLSLDGQPAEADPDVGDVGYYAPGQDLVLYHGDQSSYPGIVVLGRLGGDAAARLAALSGPVSVTVAAG